MSDIWQRPSGTLQLSPEYIDIWRVSLDLPRAQIEKYHAVLSGNELARCDKFKSGKRRREFVIGRGALRMIIGQCLKLDPSALDIVYSVHQKPHLPAAVPVVPVTFNLTHSHGLVLIALTLERHGAFSRNRSPNPWSPAMTHG